MYQNALAPEILRCGVWIYYTLSLFLAFSSLDSLVVKRHNTTNFITIYVYVVDSRSLTVVQRRNVLHSERVELYTPFVRLSLRGPIHTTFNGLYTGSHDALHFLAIAFRIYGQVQIILARRDLVIFTPVYYYVLQKEI